ncbi:MAG: TatD family hydrolase [Bacteroidales bacterium]|nr:TatD family hydrolase [Bacteroidales bacterium]
MLVDIHTHNYNLDNQCIIKVVCLNMPDFDKIQNILPTPHCYYSAAIHPWDATSYDDDVFASLTKIAKDKRVIAIGESGLDRIHIDTFEYQQDTFQKMIELSEKNHKPMIIHSVRSDSDIISVRGKSKAKMPWIIHGFNGSLQTAQQLVNHGMCISLGEILYRNGKKASDLLNNLPLDRIFFETDTAERSIADVYKTAATLAHHETENLEKIVFENFKKMFFDGKLEE